MRRCMHAPLHVWRWSDETWASSHACPMQSAVGGGASPARWAHAPGASGGMLFALALSPWRSWCMVHEQCCHARGSWPPNQDAGLSGQQGAAQGVGGAGQLRPAQWRGPCAVGLVAGSEGKPNRGRPKEVQHHNRTLLHAQRRQASAPAAARLAAPVQPAAGRSTRPPPARLPRPAGTGSKPTGSRRSPARALPAVAAAVAAAAEPSTAAAQLQHLNARA